MRGRGDAGGCLPPPDGQGDARMSALAAEPAHNTPAAPAPFARAVLAQTRAELTLTLRRGESVLITILVPAMLLAFFASLRLAPGGAGGITFLVPGILA